MNRIWILMALALGPVVAFAQTRPYNTSNANQRAAPYQPAVPASYTSALWRMGRLLRRRRRQIRWPVRP